MSSKPLVQYLKILCKFKVGRKLLFLEIGHYELRIIVEGRNVFIEPLHYVRCESLHGPDFFRSPRIITHLFQHMVVFVFRAHRGNKRTYPISETERNRKNCLFI